MSIDISQFHQVFFEESFEGLETMESGLMNLTAGAADVEAINTIFRAAHSIKGGAGTFGFKEVTEFTHVMETLLDEMRAGHRDVTREATDILLQSVDCLREMLSATHAGASHDAERVAKMKAQLEQLLSGPAHKVADAELKIASTAETASNRWTITFKPYPDLFRTGNDPARLLNELAQLGDLSVEIHTDQVPDFDAFDSESCYLHWSMELRGVVTHEQIAEVFSWVDSDCELIIQNAVPAVVDGPVTATEFPQAEVPVVPSQVQSANDKNKTQDKARPTASGENSSIRVSIEKIDAMINLVGELVITQSMLSEIGAGLEGANIEKLHDGLAQLERNTREMQQSVLGIRMLPISFSFNRFPRLVRDLSATLGKRVELRLSGEHTELDKTVMEKIGDPLVHLVRNSLDHGIEIPEKRKAAGKPETGVLSLNAYHEGGNIVIEISDDGAGLNRDRILTRARERGLVAEHAQLSDAEIYDLIFVPGFSTAEIVSDISGRGVGMDVVRRNIKDLGGVVEVRSEAGRGSTFTIRLPLTLAILDGQLVRVGQQTYIVPIVSIVESLQIDTKRVNAVVGKAELYKLRDEYLTIVRLYKLFNIDPENHDLEKGLLVVVEGDGQRVGIFVDDLLAQQQVVIKSLETNYESVPGVSGATILGNGQVALILDIAGIIGISKQAQGASFVDLATQMGTLAA